MKLIPWTERHPVTTLHDDFEDWMKEVFDLRSPFERAVEPIKRRMLPALNLAESETEYIVQLELPGMAEEDVEVQILGNKLVIAGERRFKTEKKDGEFYRVESEHGSFRRVVVLPEGLDTTTEAVKAEFDQGMLEIRLPKTKPQPTAKIKVEKKTKK